MVRGNVTTWMGSPGSPVLAHVSVPDDGASGAVVLCPPLGREQVASYRSYRQLAESLARTGLLTVRFSWTGQGDSAPIDDELSVLETWAADMSAIGEQLREAGVQKITWVGLRFGALLLARQASDLHEAGLLDAMVLWDPTPTGRAFLRHEQLLYTSAGLEGDGGSDFHALGYTLAASDADALRALKLKDIALPDVPVARITRAAEATEPGPDGAWTSNEMEALLETSSMTAAVPRRTLTTLQSWCLSQRSEDRAPVQLEVRDSAEMPQALADGTVVTVRETALTLPTGLPAILTEPVDGPPSGPGVLYVAASSEPLDGPSGLWALSARRVAALGAPALRIDKHGTGELGGALPTDPPPYLPGFIDDVHVAALWFTEHTGSRPIGVGMCSGAYFEMARPNGALFRKVVGLNLLGFNRDPARIPDEVAMATDPSHIAAMAGEHVERSTKARIRDAVKTNMPQTLWRWAGRVGAANSPDDFLREAAEDTELVLAFSPADQSAFAQQRGEAAVAWARRAGGPFEYRVDPELDHALFGVRSRRRTLQLVDDELLRCRRQDAALRTRPRGTGDAR